MSKTTWRKEIADAMEPHGESWSNVIAMAPSESEGWLDEEFHDGYGGAEGDSFTVWTSTRVYFPAVYDGAEWVESVARFPDGKVTHHIGGE